MNTLLGRSNNGSKAKIESNPKPVTFNEHFLSNSFTFNDEYDYKEYINASPVFFN